MDPSRPQRIIEAEMTVELREFCTGLDGVTNYVNQIFSVMDVAADRRPANLLVHKVRGGRNTVPPAGPEVLAPHGESNQTPTRTTAKTLSRLAGLLRVFLSISTISGLNLQI